MGLRSPKKPFLADFVSRMSAKFAVGALLVPLFGRFLGLNSANFACDGFSELRRFGVLGNGVAASKGIHRAAEKALGCM
jgi:hypothetical protein